MRATKSRLFQSSVRLEVVGIAILLVCAFVLRVASLDSIPTNITADEADNLSTVFRIKESGQPGPFGLDWKPQPAMSAYLSLGFMNIFGDTVFGLRMVSAVFSTIALVPFYLLARQVVRPWPAIAAGAMLATGQWYLHFSRSGWENVHVALYALSAALALTLALRSERRRYWWYIAAGVAAALGLYGYFAGRLILVALLAYAPLAWWWAKGSRRTVISGYAVLVATSVVLFVPQVPAIIDNWEEFTLRTDTVFVLNQPRPYHGQTSDAGVLFEQFERTARGFFFLDGEVFSNARYGPAGEPLYDRLTGALFLAGLILSVRRFRETALWWCMLLVPLLATQILSEGTPDGARAVIVAPFLYLFAALAFDEAIARFPDGFPRMRRRACNAVVAGVLVLCVWNVVHYFDWIQSPAAEEARQPAVELENYHLWRATLRDGIRAEGPDFHLDDWEERLEEMR